MNALKQLLTSFELLPTLNDIGLATGTDKASTGHDYLRRYDAHLSEIRTSAVTLLEIGVWEGASLEMWGAYFDHPNARIVGVDVDMSRSRVEDGGRVYLRTGNAASKDFLAQLAGEFEAFDVIVDDGSHQVIDQAQTWAGLWPHVKTGGFYIIEDLHTYWWPQANAPSAWEWVAQLAANCAGLGTTTTDRAGSPTPTDDIAEAHVYQSVVIFRKR
jgi:hypothetical protein